MASRAIPHDELCDAEFLQDLERLRLWARQVPAGGRYADQRSRALGHGLEFRDFRPYTAGDDLRAVDWNIYRRLGKVFVRLFEETEDLPLYLMPDVSESMFFGDRARALGGLRCAVGLAAISLDQHDSVSLLPFGEDLEVLSRRTAGAGRVFSISQRLASLEPRPGTDLVQALRRVQGMRLRPGLLAVVSDFFDPAGLDAVLDAMRPLRHKILLVQCARKGDAEPTLEGDLRLVDCESGQRQDVSLTPAVLASYKEAHARFERGLREFARRRPAGLLSLDVDEDVATQLARLFGVGRFEV